MVDNLDQIAKAVQAERRSQEHFWTVHAIASGRVSLREVVAAEENRDEES